jgi:hypothetical protein
MIIRFLAFLVGLGLIDAAAYGNVMSAGGFGTPASYYTLAMLAGIVIGAVVVGHSLVQRRLVLACFLAIGMLAGEAFNFLATADRVIFAAENVQAPLKDARQRHDAAILALTEAQAENSSPASRYRLDAAERAKDVADRIARRSCKPQ